MRFLLLFWSFNSCRTRSAARTFSAALRGYSSPTPRNSRALEGATAIGLGGFLVLVEVDFLFAGRRGEAERKAVDVEGFKDVAGRLLSWYCAAPPPPPAPAPPPPPPRRLRPIWIPSTIKAGVEKNDETGKVFNDPGGDGWSWHPQEGEGSNMPRERARSAEDAAEIGRKRSPLEAAWPAWAA